MPYFPPATGGGGTPGGSTTQVQYNNAGAFGGSADLTYNNSTKLLTAGATIATSGVQAMQITGGLNVGIPTKDSNLLYVDPTNSVVNIGTSTFDGWAKLHVNGGGARFDDDFRFQKSSGAQYVTRLGGTGFDLVFQAQGTYGDDRIYMSGSGGTKFSQATTYTRSTKTANYTANAGDRTILVDTTAGAVTITLPQVDGREYKIKKITTDTNALNITSATGNTEGVATFSTTSTTRPSYTVVSDGTNNWFM